MFPADRFADVLTVLLQTAAIVVIFAAAVHFATGRDPADRQEGPKVDRRPKIAPVPEPKANRPEIGLPGRSSPRMTVTEANGEARIRVRL